MDEWEDGTGRSVRIRPWPKIAALELLGKHLRLFADVQVHEGQVSIAERLIQARLQARKEGGVSGNRA